jgi:Tol biopolymer transport system component
MSTNRATWRRRSQSSSALALLGLVLLGSGGAKAGADRRVSLAFERTKGYDTSVWIAAADGSDARRLVRNSFNPLLSPDGRRLAYFVPRRPNALPILWVTTFAGQRTMRIGAAEGVSWAPKGHRLVFSRRKLLALLDLESGSRRVLARGDLCCASFAPDGHSVVYARSNGSFGRTFRSDVYAIRLADGQVSRLTRDRHSDRPVWGRGWIAYSHFRARGGWLIRDLRLTRSDGSGKRLLAGGNDEPSNKMGIEAVGFSHDGKRLLACLASEFQCSPVGFGIPGGRRYALRVGRRNELTFGVAISRDGTQVLAEAGGLEGPYRVLVVPLAGGEPRILVRNADHASWSQ